MNLKEQIKKDIMIAMKAKDIIKKTTLRGIMATFTNQLISDGLLPSDELSNEKQIAVLKRLVKQRKDSISKFEDGERQDLADNEKLELSILEKYLPEMMKLEDVEKIAIELKDDLKIDDKSKMGILIGAVMKKTSGNADGLIVKNVVEKLFN